MTKRTYLLTAAGLTMGLLPTCAWGQTDWASMDRDTLRGEVQQRYDAALALTLDPAIVNGNNPRYLWASEAKVQCGIALGFLKRGNRDETSLSKCYMAADMMNRVPQPPVVQSVPETPAPACNRAAPDIIFFEFDSATPPTDAAQVADYVAQNAGPCTWRTFTVTGHADRSGSNAYNMGLSQRRADAIAEMLAARGIPRSSIRTGAEGEENPRVPTEDGVRELQNRRVEIQASQ